LSGHAGWLEIVDHSACKNDRLQEDGW